MADERFTLTVVAFLRSVGGVVTVLLTVDEGSEPRHGGEPVLLLEHRPGSPVAAVLAESSQALPERAIAVVLDHAAVQLVAAVEAAFDDSGTFHGGRLVGAAVELTAPAGSFGS